MEKNGIIYKLIIHYLFRLYIIPITVNTDKNNNNSTLKPAILVPPTPPNESNVIFMLVSRPFEFKLAI